MLTALILATIIVAVSVSAPPSFPLSDDRFWQWRFEQLQGLPTNRRGGLHSVISQLTIPFCKSPFFFRETVAVSAMRRDNDRCRE